MPISFHDHLYLISELDHKTHSFEQRAQQARLVKQAKTIPALLQVEISETIDALPRKSKSKNLLQQVGYLLLWLGLKLRGASTR
jgi:hypothetical protein